MREEREAYGQRGSHASYSTIPLKSITVRAMGIRMDYAALLSRATWCRPPWRWADPPIARLTHALAAGVFLGGDRFEMTRAPGDVILDVPTHNG